MRLLEEAGFVTRVHGDVEEAAGPPEDAEAEDGGAGEQESRTLVGAEQVHRCRASAEIPFEHFPNEPASARIVH